MDSKANEAFCGDLNTQQSTGAPPPYAVEGHAPYPTTSQYPTTSGKINNNFYLFDGRDSRDSRLGDYLQLFQL